MNEDNVIDFKKKYDEKHGHLHQLWLDDERRKLIAEFAYFNCS